MTPKLLASDQSTLTLSFRDTPTASYDGSMAAGMAQQGISMKDLVFAYLGEECVADVQVEKHATHWSLHPHVCASWRRRGVATALYDHFETLAREAGLGLKPSSFQTQEAVLFWNARSPLASRLALRRETSPSANPERPAFPPSVKL